MTEAVKQNEEIVLDTKAGDYWRGGLIASQISGTYTFTNQKIRFESSFGGTVLELPYTDIASAALCNVGPLIKFLPTGILIRMKDGKTYRLFLMKRKKFLALVESNV